MMSAVSLFRGLRQEVGAQKGSYFACRDLPVTFLSHCASLVFKVLGILTKFNTEIHISLTMLGKITFILYMFFGNFYICFK